MKKRFLKKVMAIALSVFTVFSTVNVGYGYTVQDGSIVDLDEGEFIYLLGGSMTGWNVTNPDAVFSDTSLDGVIQFNTTFPSSEAGEWERRACIIGNYYDGYNYVQGSWTRMLIGEPNYKPDDTFTSMSWFSVDNLEEYKEVTIYYDTRTAVLLILDTEGNRVDYTLGWITNDRDEIYYTPEEFAQMSIDEYLENLSVDRRDDYDYVCENTEMTYSLFDGSYLGYLDGLEEYVKTGRDYYDGNINKNISSEIGYEDTVYTVDSDISTLPGEPEKVGNMLKIIRKGSSIISAKIYLPAKETDESEFESFRINKYDYNHTSGHNAILAGITGANIDSITEGNFSTFYVERTSEAKQLTVYFDTNTYGVYIRDENGKDVDYYMDWAKEYGLENNVRYSLEDISKMSVAEYLSTVSVRVQVSLSNAWIYPDSDMDMPDFAALRDRVKEKVNSKYPNKINFHFLNNEEWENVGAWIYEGFAWERNATDNCFITIGSDENEDKINVWPGALCENEGGNWYKATASFSDEIMTKGIALIFNNFVANSHTNDTFTSEMLDAVYESGIETDATAECKQTSNVIINKRELATLGSVPPTDIYIMLSDGKYQYYFEAPEEYIKDVEEYEGLCCKTEDDNSITIVGYNGSERDIVIPDTINGKVVKAIGENAFRDSNISSVVLPDTVEVIGKNAFYNCSSLIGIELSAGLKKIEQYAFYETAIRYIDIPDSVTSIEGGAFSDCYELKTAKLPEGLKVIPEGMFKDCNNLKSVNIPDNLESIGDYAFSWCYRLESIKMPDTVTYLGKYAFYDCYDLKSVNISTSLDTINEYAFCQCSNIGSINIPDNIISIGDKAFYGVGSANITGMKYVETIGEDAFANCYNISTLNLNKIKTIKCGAFRSCSKLSSVKFGSELSTIEPLAFKECVSLSEVTIPEKTVSIGSGAFIDCSNLSKATINGKETVIRLLAFDGCRDDFTIYCKGNSKASEFANKYGIKVVESLEVEISSSAVKCGAGEKIVLTAKAAGGSGNYTYSFLAYNKTTKSWYRFGQFAGSNQLTWTSNAGDRLFYAEVKDSTGKVVRSKALNVVTNPKLSLTASADKSEVSTKETVVITAKAAGGSEEYTYSYLIYNPATNQWFRCTKNFVKSNTYKWVAGSSGQRKFYVEVKDNVSGKVLRSSAVAVNVK